MGYTFAYLSKIQFFIYFLEKAKPMKTFAQIALPIIAIILILTMLQFGPSPSEGSTGILQLPTGTAVELPVFVDTPLPPSETPTAAPVPPIFRDDFKGALVPGWVWINEDRAAWNLTAFPGYLQMTLSTGIVRESNAANVLLYPIPEGDIQVTTMFTFRPSENFQFAGLIFYASDANHLQIGRSYCRGFGEPCIKSGVYIQYYQDYRIGTPNEASSYNAITPIILRVTRRGNEYALDVSSNGEVWVRFSKYTIDFQPTHVGLIAAGNQRAPATALFDFFEISAAPK